MIFQREDRVLQVDRKKKDLTLAELNHVFKMYLGSRGLRPTDISIVAQFSIIFNEPRLSRWHTLSKQAQNESLSDLVILPRVYDELIEKLGTAAGDAQIIKSVVKDAYQNSIDSFSHAAFLQHKYQSRYAGLKLILFLDHEHQRLILALVDNGFGERVIKPKKSTFGLEYGDNFMSRTVDWLVRRYIEKEPPVDRRIAYTGGQGMALKKLRIELQLDVGVHFFATGAVFELRLNSAF